MAESIPEHVFVRGEGGSVFKLDLPLHETIADRLAKGYLTRVANADGDPYVEGAETATVPTPPTAPPKKNDAKTLWVGWAVVNGMTPDDAEALTKDDLIERFSTKQAPATPTEPTTPEGETGDSPDGDDSSEPNPEGAESSTETGDDPADGPDN